MSLERGGFCAGVHGRPVRLRGNSFGISMMCVYTCGLQGCATTSQCANVLLRSAGDTPYVIAVQCALSNDCRDVCNHHHVTI